MKVIAILFGLIMMLPLTNNEAHAEYDGFGNYFCWSYKTYAEDEYWSKVTGFNSGVEHSSGSIEKLNEVYVKEGSGVDDMGKMAVCLKEEHNVDPDSVIMFSDKGQEVLSYDMEKLMEIAPGVAKYATVPEFEEIAMMVLVSGIIGIVVMSRKFV